MRSEKQSTVADLVAALLAMPQDLPVVVGGAEPVGNYYEYCDNFVVTQGVIDWHRPGENVVTVMGSSS